MDSDLFDEDHELFRASVREFVDKQVVRKLQQWDADRLIDRETWRTAGRHGLLGLTGPQPVPAASAIASPLR
jgi:acyl-CoA dehydrogenase